MKLSQKWKKLTKDYRRLHLRVRRDKKTFLIYTVLRALVILSLIDNVIRGDYEAAALCVLSLVLFLMPAFFEKQLKIEIPPLFEGIIYCFIFAAEILGEVNKFYTLFPGWDSMLHTLNGFLCAAIGFAMVDLLNRHSERLNLSPVYLAIVSFCFSMTIGVMWEFIEFTCDQLFYLDMQKDFIVKTIGSITLDPTNSQKPVVISNITRTIIETADGSRHVIEGGYLDIGLIDTMKDLFVNFLGAAVFSVFGYIYVKTRDADSIVGKLMVHRMTAQEVQEVDEFIDRQEQERQELQGQIRSGQFIRSGTGQRRRSTGQEQKDAWQENSGSGKTGSRSAVRRSGTRRNTWHKDTWKKNTVSVSERGSRKERLNPDSVRRTPADSKIVGKKSADPESVSRKPAVGEVNGEKQMRRSGDVETSPQQKKRGARTGAYAKPHGKSQKTNMPETSMTPNEGMNPTARFSSAVFDLSPRPVTEKTENPGKDRE